MGPSTCKNYSNFVNVSWKSTGNLVEICLVGMEIYRKLQPNYTFVMLQYNTIQYNVGSVSHDNFFSNNTYRYQNVIIHLGAFHIICSFLSALRRMVVGMVSKM